MQAEDCVAKWSGCVLATVCLALASAGYGQNQPSTVPYVPITMQQAVDLARAKNPTLLSAQQNLLSVKAQEIQAGVRQNPNLVVTGSNVTLGEDSNNPYYYSVGVSRLFERGEKRRWRLDSARSTTAQTDAQYHAQEQQTILCCTPSLYELCYCQGSKETRR